MIKNIPAAVCFENDTTELPWILHCYFNIVKNGIYTTMTFHENYSMHLEPTLFFKAPLRQEIVWLHNIIYTYEEMFLNPEFTVYRDM